MNIRILDEAQADLREGAEFYECQNVGLGTYFLDTIFSDIESLILYAGVHIKLNGYNSVAIKNFSIRSLLPNRWRYHKNLRHFRL